jgi:hypothetical protein
VAWKGSIVSVIIGPKLSLPVDKGAIHLEQRNLGFAIHPAEICLVHGLAEKTGMVPAS